MTTNAIKTTTLLALLAAGTCATSASAQELGRVISSTPTVQQVGVPRQVCTNQQATVTTPKSGAGAMMGAIAGGGLGNAVGQGGGKALATLAGVMGGAILGNNIEGTNTQVQNVQQCSTQTFYENRTVGYNVVYEYGGKQYNVQMPNDPGPTIQLQVSPVGSNNGNPGGHTYQTAPQYEQQQPQAVIQQQSTYTYATPGVVTYAAPAYAPTYYAAPYASPYPSPYYAPIGVSLGVGYYRGFGHHHRWR